MVLKYKNKSSVIFHTDFEAYGNMKLLFTVRNILYELTKHKKYSIILVFILLKTRLKFAL